LSGNSGFPDNSLLVMSPALGYFDGVPPNPIHQAVFFIDSAGPPPGKVSSEGFRFPQTGVTAALNVFEKLVNFVCHFFVVGLPIEVL
jgi:hypothetical protein